MDLSLAVPLSVMAALFFAVSSVLQQQAARRVPESRSLKLRLLLDLVTKPAWLAGILCGLAAFACEAIALAFGPIAVVEPLICLELVFALPLATFLRRLRAKRLDINVPGWRFRLGRREWGGAIAVAGGVGLFLALSSPKGGFPEPSLVTWGKVALPVLVAAAACLVVARGPETPRRAMLLAASAGLCFALLALVTQSFVTLVSTSGAIAALESWQPYVLLGFGAASFTIGQSAFQAAPLAVSLPVIDSVEPAVAVVLASFAFGQRLDLAAPALLGECLGAVAAVTGVWLLGRSPLVISVYEQQQARKDRRAALAGASAESGWSAGGGTWVRARHAPDRRSSIGA
jgi:hypothetical protein